jgi:hypothetical protein
MDCVCVGGDGVLSWLIRLFSAGLKNATNKKKASHVGLVVDIGGKYWIAEMLGTGLEINSLHDYTKPKAKSKIVCIKRLSVFDNAKTRQDANNYLVTLANTCPPPYDVKGVLEHIGLCKDSPSKMYCSELAEVVANRFGATWDNFNLTSKKSTISPYQIQRGRGLTVDFEA